jgi:polysaccharide export outer membrane protein
VTADGPTAFLTSAPRVLLFVLPLIFLSPFEAFSEARPDAPGQARTGIAGRAAAAQARPPQPAPQPVMPRPKPAEPAAQAPGAPAPAAQGPATQAPAAQARAAQAAPQVPTESAAADYQIGAQDILRITVYGHEDLTQTVLVQPDGTFTFPLIGRVKASDNTPAELEKKIGTLLSKGFIRNPQVTVVVQEFRSKTVYVVGEVARPGPYPLAGHTTLVEVLAKAGPTANAGAEVVIVRPRQGAAVTGPTLPAEVATAGGAAAAGGAGADGAAAGSQAQVFRVAVGAIQAGHLDQNIALQPNDTVFVPQAPKVFVTGEVRNAGAYGWFPGLTARQLISLAGGLTPDGSNSRLKVVRQQGGESKESGIKLDAAIQPGDTLVVRRRLF